MLTGWGFWGPPCPGPPPGRPLPTPPEAETTELIREVPSLWGWAAGPTPLPTCPGAGQTALMPTGFHPTTAAGRPAERRVTPRQASAVLTGAAGLGAGAAWLPAQRSSRAQMPGYPNTCHPLPALAHPPWDPATRRTPHPGHLASGLWAPAPARNLRPAPQLVNTCSRLRLSLISRVKSGVGSTLIKASLP